MASEPEIADDKHRVKELLRGAADSDSRFRAAADLLDGYVHESSFVGQELPADHRIVWASEGFETIFGCTIEQYNRNGIWGGCYDAEESEAAVRRAQALRRGETVEAELRITRPNGEVRWLYVKNKPIIDALTQTVTGVLGVGLDITRRKTAERMQQKAESILSSVTRSDPDWFLLLDLNLRVQFINRPFLSAVASIEIDAPLPAFLSEVDNVRIRSMLCEVIESGAPIVAEVSFESVRKEVGHLEIRAFAFREHVGITGLAVRIVDISARKRDEESLRTHAIILETMQEGVILFDAMGIVRYSNAASGRLFGMPLDVLLGASIKDLGIHYRFTRDRNSMINETRRSTIPEVLCTRRDGNQFLAKLTFTELTLRAQDMAIAVLYDVTEQKKLEREIIDIANREQQRIAVDLHDGLGQELTGVALMLRSLAENQSVDHSAKQNAINEIIALVNHAIQEARTLARGLSPVELERGGIKAALNSLATRTREAGKMQVTFCSQIPWSSSMPAAVAGHLYRIAQESVVNAVRHSGAKTIWIALGNRHGELELSIADDGHGIIAQNSSQDGMGLRIMDYRARMIGGHISVRTREEGGTIVVCRVLQDWKR